MYVKIFASILDSSIWQAPAESRIVWITMLAMADREGFVRSSVPGLARRANVSMKACQASLRILSDPDLDSGSQAWGGRRIDRLEGGWTILNYTKYREITRREDRRASLQDVGYVYYAAERPVEKVKIGFGKNPWARVATLRTAIPKLEIIATERGTMEDEHARHQQFKADHMEGEWFLASPDLLEHISSLGTPTTVATVATVVLEADAKVEAPAKTSAPKARAETWLTPYMTTYETTVGAIKPGRLAAALKPVHAAAGAEKALALFTRWCASDKAGFGPEWFAANWKRADKPNGKPRPTATADKDYRAGLEQFTGAKP